MRYAIMIRNDKDNEVYKFLKVRKEQTETVTEEVTNEETGEVSTVEKEVGTGVYKTEKYLTDSKDEFEAKIVETLNTYNRNQILPIAIEDFNMDLIFDSDSEKE